MSEQVTKEEKTYCHYHPDVETNVSCSSCGKPICPKDMVFTSVGAKCKECAAPVGRMIAGPKPIYLVKGALAGLGAAVASGILVSIFRAIIPFGGFLFAIGIGYAIGEAVSWGARRNTGISLQIIAGISAFLAFTLAGYTFGRGILFGQLILAPNLFGLFIALIGISIAVMRLRD